MLQSVCPVLEIATRTVHRDYLVVNQNSVGEAQLWPCVQDRQLTNAEDPFDIRRRTKAWGMLRVAVLQHKHIRVLFHVL